MKKIVVIGEFVLDVVFDSGGQPVGSMAGGREVNAALILAREGMETALVGELSTDAVGESIMRELVASGVELKGVDRYGDGSTATELYFPDAEGVYRTVRYEDYPEECFDVIWPRVERGDIVVFGDYYSIDQRMRPRMLQFLNYCDSVGAVMVYVPGFDTRRSPRVTRVMPVILENLELANIVVTRTPDLKTIFGIEDPERSYKEHIDFYCRSLVNIDVATGDLSYFSAKEVSHANIKPEVTRSLIGRAGLVAGIAKYLAVNDVDRDSLDGANADLRGNIIVEAVNTARSAFGKLDNEWQAMH